MTPRDAAVTAADVTAAPAPAEVDGAGDTAVWSARFTSLLITVDCVAIFIALVSAYFLRFKGSPDAAVHGLSYALLLVFAGPVWLAALLMHRCYDPRTFGAGPTEFRRVALATIRLYGAVAIVCFLFKISLSRGFFLAASVIGLALLLVGRYATRHWLHARRRAGGWSHRLLVLGDPDHVDELATVLAREPYAGYAVVGACVPGVPPEPTTAGGVPLLGPMTTVVEAARAAGCDAIAITASPGISAATLRRLAWDLEGSGISLVVAPALTDVAGPRISVHPVAGLPLLHVDEPELGAVHRTVKRTMDLAITVVGLVLLAPVFLALAVAVRVGSRGPVLFRQTRVGRDGAEFVAYKFRSMRADAEAMLPSLRERNEAAGLLFKIRADPRITGVGRVLRRTSLDELPQLWNVLRGEMSLVGPRPPLPDEVVAYESDVRRRLLVKPGITGLWQVSGRSDLSWEDSVRLDLYYVENWSPLLDLVILARTVVAVVRGAGAY